MVNSLQAQILNTSEEGLAGAFSKTNMGVLKYDGNLVNIPREVVLTYVYLWLFIIYFSSFICKLCLFKSFLEIFFQ